MSRILGLVICFFLPLSAQAWTPDGASDAASKECHPQLWTWKFLDAKTSFARAEIFDQWQSNCNSQFRTGKPQGDLAEQQLRSLTAGPWNLKPLQVTLPKSGELRGWTLFQDSRSPRPTILIHCGFTCDPMLDPWLKQVIMHLYEEGPFHLIALASPEADLSPRWIAGGIDAGGRLIELGYWLQTQSAWRGKIESLQLLGEGYGAHATLYAQYYNDHNKIADDRKVFHGGLHLCPAVRMASVLESVARPQSLSQEELSRNIFSGFLARGWNPDVSLWPNFSMNFIQQKNLSMQPFKSLPPDSEARFLEDSDFAMQGVPLKTAGWVVGASGDVLFPDDQHLAPLMAQNVDPKKSSVRVLRVPDESHCAFAVSEGWAVNGAIYRALLLAQAHEIWPKQSRQMLPWNGPTVDLAPGETHKDQIWSVEKSGKVNLTFILESKNGERRYSVEIPATILPAQLQKEVHSQSEADVWSRSLNTQLRLMGSSGPLVDSKENPFKILFWKW